LIFVFRTHVPAFNATTIWDPSGQGLEPQAPSSVVFSEKGYADDRGMVCAGKVSFGIYCFSKLSFGQV